MTSTAPVWTTTPGRCPPTCHCCAGEHGQSGNAACHIDPSAGQKSGTENQDLAQALLEKVFRGEEVVLETFSGKAEGARHQLLCSHPAEKKAHYVILGDFVSTEDAGSHRPGWQTARRRSNTICPSPRPP